MPGRFPLRTCRDVKVPAATAQAQTRAGSHSIYLEVFIAPARSHWCNKQVGCILSKDNGAAGKIDQ